MNAQGVKDEHHLERLLDDPAFVAQEKLDGMRAIVHVTLSGLRIFSRSAGVADPTRPLEKTISLPHLARLTFPKLADSILDGEILLPGEDSATLAGTVHRKETNGSNHQVKLFVFDVLRYRGTDVVHKTYQARLFWLDEVEARITSEYVAVLPIATERIAKRKLYQDVLAKGGEGIILKRLDAFYIPSARPSDNWYKAKRSATFDCVVIGFTKGEGKYNKWIGAVRFGQYVDGKLVELGQASGMTDTIRRDMSDNPDRYIGKVVSIKGMERLTSGAIRHPQFVRMRSDKKQRDCIWYEGEQ